MQQEDFSHTGPERVVPVSAPGVKGIAKGKLSIEIERALRLEAPSLSKMSHNARESMGALGLGLKQLFQHQRIRLAQSPGQGSAAAAAGGTMRRGTSLQSRRSKGSGSGSAERDPHVRGSPQAAHRRHTHDPQQHTSRRRRSSSCFNSVYVIDITHFRTRGGD
uniref:Uncharacterized protein n=1 Tax=Gouania willdenowi TaxID=441366 RepID=A0A8C5DAM6_GOUWI